MFVGKGEGRGGERGGGGWSRLLAFSGCTS